MIKRNFLIFMSVLMLISSAHSVPIKKDKLSTETKGVIVGGSATGIATTVGVSLFGVTAIVPAVLIGSAFGFIGVKSGKSIKKFREKKIK